MTPIVDLHIHSHYSRATSRSMDITSLYRWGKLKGIQVMGTGDFTHPQWFAELREKLEPAEPGLFRLKPELAKEQDKLLPAMLRDKPMRFVLSVEISNIYSKNGRVRKLHNLVIVPSFEAASAINAKLERIGNLKADGRPILGLDSKELLKIALAAEAMAIFIPAHIWTPWFGMFGSKSGFDSLAEAFDELAPEVKAIETGLSSDPYMNWRVSELENVAIMSNSDAHSPEKLGREASVLNCELTYKDIRETIRTNDKRFVGTIEFFPQEGKYHYDGHRLCGVRFSPKETKEHKGICPKCGLPLVVGVDYRVEELADRSEDYKPPKKKLKKVEYIIPLVEMIAEIKEMRSVSSKAVKAEYVALTQALGDEFSILRSVPVENIRQAGFTEMAEAIRRMRAGEVVTEPGYDGVYGVIKVFPSAQEVRKATGQLKMI
jgi:DNA helicase-2/ATP-dependent DNA helicase PcrA